MRPILHGSLDKPSLPFAEKPPSATFTINRTGTDSLDAQAVVTVGTVIAQAVLTGWLFVRDNALDMELAHLNDFAEPVYYHPLYDALLHNNPQLMPLPARIKYTLDAYTATTIQTNNVLRQCLEHYIDDIKTRYVIGPSNRMAIAIDSDKVKYDINSETTADVVTNVLKHGHGILVEGGTALYEIPVGEQVTLSVQDFKCYSALDEPLNILDVTLASGESIAHIYLPDECTGTVPQSWAHDYVADLDTTSLAGKKWLDHNDFNQHTQAVLHITQGTTTREAFVDFNKFEKYALFPSNISWHVKNWCISGVYDSADRSSQFTLELFPNGSAANLFYETGRTTAITGYPGTTGNITPPALDINGYSSGQDHGEALMTYTGFEINHLKFYVRRNSGSDAFSVTRAAMFSGDTNPATAPPASTHKFTIFHYEAARGFEEYIKRVASSEYAFGGTNFGKEGLKAQILAARTYTVFHLLDGNHSLTNPIKLNYAEQRVIETTSFHVHTIERFNNFMQNNAKRLAMEEAMADTWGMVATFRGKLIDAEYFAGSSLVRSTLDVAAKDYCKSVHISDGANAASDQAVVGHGRGLSQNGSRNLATLSPELNHLQIMHWFYFGIQMRNGYGLGDIVTNPPTNTAAGGWVITNPQPAIPSDSLYNGTSADWTAAGVTAAGNWSLSHNFTALEYCKDAAGAATANLNVSKRAVLAIQFLRFVYDDSMEISAVTTTTAVKVRVKANSAANLAPLKTKMNTALTTASTALNNPANFTFTAEADTTAGGFHIATWTIQV